VARFGVDYYPAFVWTDSAGEELLRTVQPGDAGELLADLDVAAQELSAADGGE